MKDETLVELNPAVRGMTKAEIDRRLKHLVIERRSKQPERAGLEMTAKYRGRCRSCGRTIQAGTRILYDPATKCAEHFTCPQ